jgi:hypothetical protein
MEVSGQIYALAALTPGKNPNTCWIGGMMSPRASMDGLKNSKISYSCQNSSPRSSSLQPSHYTKYTTSAPPPSTGTGCMEFRYWWGLRFFFQSHIQNGSRPHWILPHFRPKAFFSNKADLLRRRQLTSIQWEGPDISSYSLFNNNAVSISHCTSLNGRMIVNNRSKRMLKETVMY